MGGVLLFPFIRLFAPFRHYVIGFVFLALFGYQISLVLQSDESLETQDPQLADVVAYEDLLKQKAERVLQRFNANDYSVDLSVVLDHTQVTTTTFDPGQESEENSGTWQEEISTSPRVLNIKICITLDQDDNINSDDLFRSLSYAIGIDLSRGDVLRLVVL